MAGTAMALALFACPVPTFVRIARKGSTEAFSGSPYLISLTQCSYVTGDV